MNGASVGQRLLDGLQGVDYLIELRSDLPHFRAHLVVLRLGVREPRVADGQRRLLLRSVARAGHINRRLPRLVLQRMEVLDAVKVVEQLDVCRRRLQVAGRRGHDLLLFRRSLCWVLQFEAELLAHLQLLLLAQVDGLHVFLVIVEGDDGAVLRLDGDGALRVTD